MTLPPVRQPPTRAERLAGPEVIGTVLAVVLLVVIGTSALAAAVPRPTPRPTAAPPGPSASPTAPSATPLVNPTTVNVLRTVNASLEVLRTQLVDELARDAFRAPDVQDLVRQVRATVNFAAPYVPSLGGALGAEEAGGRLSANYTSIAELCDRTLDNSVRNETEYQIGAALIVDFLAAIPAIQGELDRLAIPPSTPAPTPTPTISTGPSSPPPTATPPPVTPPPATPPPATPTPKPTPSPTPPTSAPPSPSAPPGDKIVNGGFETGTAPWELVLAAGTVAALSRDPVLPAAGAAAARVDITAGNEAYGGISLRQAGLSLDAGARYTLTLFVRSQEAGEFRIRIISAGGASYMTRLGNATSAWTRIQITFTAPIPDASAILALDMGRSGPTMWVDAVSFAPAS